jgi:periplasmic divalent cation tolerance protein
MAKYIQIITTVNKKEDAEKIAKILIEKRLSGCVQIIGPIKSNYWWEGKIETAKEWLCFIKSKGNLYKEIEKSIKEVHPYKIPEIIAISVVNGYKKYFKWLEVEIKK